MKLEKSAKWHDEAYAKGKAIKGTCVNPPEETVYYPVWMKALEFIDKRDPIVDLGCGTGQFAELCIKHGYRYMMGVDFSKVAINIAKERFKKIVTNSIDTPFWVDDIRSIIIKYPAKVVTMFSVLEYITNDQGIIHRIPKGVQVVFSVPDYDYRSHVRHFKDIRAIEYRYGKMLDIQSIAPFLNGAVKQIYLCDSVKI